jgi:hypothetical protein
MLDLHILHDTCTPFSPEQKPFVERVFRSLLHDNMELLAGYVGHNVTERKDIEARRSFADRLMNRRDVQEVTLKLTADELQQVCDRWSNDTYMHRRHSKLGCTPWEKARDYDGPIARVASEEALRLLCLPLPQGDGTRVVQKDGIHLLNDVYIAPALALHERRRVLPRVDDVDYGRVHVYSLDGTEYLCTARGIKHSGLTGEQVRNIAATAKRLQRAKLTEGKAGLRAAAKAINLNQIEYERMQMDELRARRIEAEQPLRAEQMNIHSTPALEATAVAAMKPDYTPAPETEAERAERQKERVAFEAAVARAKAKPEDAVKQRKEKYRTLMATRASGDALSPEEQRWIKAYEQTPEGDTQRCLRKHVGPDGLLTACG